MSHLPDRLPGHEGAWIDAEKLVGYCLNPDHETGRHKARVFASALAIGIEDWHYLAVQIFERLPHAPVTRINPTMWGVCYEVVVMVDGRNGATHPVKTAWLVESDGDPPRLLTAYVDVP